MLFRQPFARRRSNGKRGNGMSTIRRLNHARLRILEAKFACAKPMWWTQIWPRGNDARVLSCCISSPPHRGARARSLDSCPRHMPSRNFLEIVDETENNIEFVSAREAIEHSGPMVAGSDHGGSIAERNGRHLSKNKTDGAVQNWGAAVGRAPLDVGPTLRLCVNALYA